MGCFRVTKCKKKTSKPNMFLGIHSLNHPPTAFPKSPTLRAWPSAPPNFPDRVTPVQQNNRITNTKVRALSAPSNLDAAEQDALSGDYEKQLYLKSPYGSMKERQNPNPQPLPLPLPPKAAVQDALSGDYEKQLYLKSPYGSMKERQNPNPQPLPLPLPPKAAVQDALSSDYEKQLYLQSPYGSMKKRQNPNPQPLPLPLPPKAAVLKNLGSFKELNASGPSNISGPQPLPLPLPLPLSQPSTLPQSLPSIGLLRNFSYGELATACNNFCPGRCMSRGLSSMIYRASFGDDSSGFRKLEATVTCFMPSIQGLKEFLKEVNTLGYLQHPNLCNLLGFHARQGSKWRMLVYERLYHGSLDRLLYGRSDGPFLDWPSRMKVATCAAKGLTFLHEDGPFQAMFHEFSTGNIQIDKDYSAKLSGYGCESLISGTDVFSNSVAPTSLLVEVQNKGLLTPKSNVWSFGIVLLELLTGRRNEEGSLVKWSRPYLSDNGRLWLIMDPQLRGRFPDKAARLVADIIQRCLQADPLERPTMRTILEHLKVIQQMEFTFLVPLPEPGSVRSKNMSKSPNLDEIITPGPRSSISSSQKARCVSPSPLGLPLSLYSQSCSSTLSSEEFERRGLQFSSSASKDLMKIFNC